MRPWCLDHSDCFLREGIDLNPRKTVFVGGVPRLLKAQELASIMDNNFGFVCYAGVDVDPWMKYPKGENMSVPAGTNCGYENLCSCMVTHLHCKYSIAYTYNIA